MDSSQESDPYSQVEIPVLSSYDKYFECYVRERYLKNIWSNFRIPGHFIYICRCALKNEVYSNSCHSEQEVQLRMFTSYRSFELALLFSFYTNEQFK